MLAPDSKPDTENRAAALELTLGDRDAETILSVAIDALFPGRIALASSLGAESAVLLHMIARIARHTPVLFLDTGMLFPETLAYRDKLVAELGLDNVQSIRPSPRALATEDPEDALWADNPDRCCAIRKVLPFARAIAGYDAWITGRKRYQGGQRTDMPVFEADGPRIKINPLASWSQAELTAYIKLHGIPPHPLVEKGYQSIGCIPCTSITRPGQSARSGRWGGKAKTECGLHLPLPPVQPSGA
jgi:phosphoadenosine phosphosulfate reductase